MDLGIRGRVALVCGASQGLGKAVAMALGREGVKLAICSRNEDKLKKAAEDLRSATGTDVQPIAADVSIPADVKKLVEQTVAHFGKLEILVPNAGGPPIGKFLEQPEDAWQKALELN